MGRYTSVQAYGDNNPKVASVAYEGGGGEGRAQGSKVICTVSLLPPLPLHALQTHTTTDHEPPPPVLASEASVRAVPLS